MVKKMLAWTYGNKSAIALLCAVVGGLGCSSETAQTAGSPDPGSPYPGGPYGFEQGAVIGNLQLETPAGDTFSLDSLYDGDGKAALLYVTATWCFTCGPEIDWLNDYAPRVDGRLDAMSVVLQNKQFQDATAEDAAQFDQGYGPVFATLLDPNGALDVFREEAFIPLNVLIDTATMRITYRAVGFSKPTLTQEIDEILETPR
ncbi:redoxin domain-containing protein [Desulfobulbus sp. AH-315-M07]|nr:redoxin domain-containing protein [Desulfobulbus sp. AH-315-M07]